MMSERVKANLFEKAKKQNDNECIICKQIIYKTDEFEVCKIIRNRIILFHSKCYKGGK